MGSLEGPKWQLDENLLNPHHDTKCCDLARSRPMPVILDPDSYDLWPDPGMRDVSGAPELLKPYDARLMRCYPVSSRINRPENDDEGCSRPVELAEAQNSLFAK